MLLILLFNIAYALLLMLFAQSFRRGRKNEQAVLANPPIVSVIIPVRNEQQHLRQLISSLQQQNYPQHLTEWIFVDDHSSDQSAEILKQRTDQRIKIIHLGGNAAGKKAALSAGIQQARGKWIITTDADCIHPAGWVSALVGEAETTGAVMVCGLVEVSSGDTAAQRFQQMETAVLQVSGAGSLKMGHALLNTGTSLCFLKDAWQQINGYDAHTHIASGDDTFLMLRFMQKFPGKVVPLINSTAVVNTQPADSWKKMLQQRIRWNGKVRHYPPGSVHLTGFIVFFSGLLWLMTGLIIKNPVVGLGIFTGVFLLRAMAEGVVLRSWKTVAGQSFSPAAILLMSFFYPVFTLYSLIIRPFMKVEWKGRKV